MPVKKAFQDLNSSCFFLLELRAEQAQFRREARRSGWEMTSCSRVVNEMGCGSSEEPNSAGEMPRMVGDDEEKMLDIGMEEDEFEGLEYNQSEALPTRSLMQYQLLRRMYLRRSSIVQQKPLFSMKSIVGRGFCDAKRKEVEK
ncbi:uncharacterized protein [Arachis hypogaea]|uniref:uncharacterized protein n=1 Tax=Arachis hypogaea TaxID=3818 RepID=UPI000DECB0C5|nr:uncharacterized protein LOC112702895 [Arachis hypogaea]QHO28072.1 uncharacterized protein DS421_7g213490 [Arachis hypogaea]